MARRPVRELTALHLLVVFAAPLSAQTPQTLRVSDGAEIAFNVSGQGPPIVFLHGFLGTMELWSEVGDALESEFTIVRIDLRGHGYSTNPDDFFDHAKFGEDAAAVMSHLGFAQYGAVGHSAGAIGVLHLATRYPERVTWQAVLGGSPKLARSLRNALAQYPSFDGLDSNMRDYLLEVQPHGRPQIDRLLWGMRDYARDRDDIDFDAADLGLISGPTLVVWGDRDGSPVELAVQLYRQIPDADLWVIPDMGHQVIWPRFGGSLAVRDELVDRLRVLAGRG